MFEVQDGMALQVNTVYVMPPNCDMALINGTQVQGFELDDTHLLGVLHTGAVVLPALIPVAETHPGMSGKEFIAAAGVGLTSQYVEQFGRKLLGGLLGIERELEQAGYVPLFVSGNWHEDDERKAIETLLSRRVDVLTLARISGHLDVSLLLRVYYRETAQEIAARLASPRRPPR